MRRLRLVAGLVMEAKALSEVKRKIEADVRREIGKDQREAILREQLRAIKKELGEDRSEGDLETLRERLDKAAEPLLIQLSRRLRRRLCGAGGHSAAKATAWEPTRARRRRRPFFAPCDLRWMQCR